MIQTLRRTLSRAVPRNWRDARDAAATVRHLVLLILLLLGCCSGGYHHPAPSSTDSQMLDAIAR